MKISEDRLHLSNSNEFNCIRFALSLQPENFKIDIKNKVMKRRIIYVGTLIDLVAIFEPDVEAESIEVTNIIKYESYE